MGKINQINTEVNSSNTVNTTQNKKINALIASVFAGMMAFTTPANANSNTCDTNGNGKIEGIFERTCVANKEAAEAQKRIDQIQERIDQTQERIDQTQERIDQHNQKATEYRKEASEIELKNKQLMGEIRANIGR